MHYNHCHGVTAHLQLNILLLLILKQTNTSISSFTLRDTNPTKMGKSDKGKATVFAKNLADVFQPHAQEIDEEILNSSNHQHNQLNP
jgi:hypothetical protein